MLIWNRIISTMAIVTLLCLTGSLAAQMTDEELEALQQQAIDEAWTFTIGRNSATERPMHELCGLIIPDDWETVAEWDPMESPTDDLPAAFDWRDYDGCTSIKDQRSCGSCWAFSTVGALECAIKIQDGIETDLSEQWLVSCNDNGWGCNGGWFAHTYHLENTDPCGGTGAVLEADFPYTARDDSCDCPYPHHYYIDSVKNIGYGGMASVEEMKQAIYDHGPISVAVAVDGAFSGYNGGIFNGCQGTSINHAVVLVGWDDNQGSDGIWILRNSWGQWWGEDGYMRIEYNCNEVGYAANYVVYSGLQPLDFHCPEGLPESIDPNGQTQITIDVTGITASPIPGTGMFHYMDNEQWVDVPMDILGENLYEVTFPAHTCGDPFDYYFSAMTDLGQEVTDPYLAPEREPHHTCAALGMNTIFEDDFETDTGWQVINESLGDGAWTRTVPSNSGYRADPPSDYDGSGRCYLTGAGSVSDVEGGPTRLISPAFDLEGREDAYIRFARWFVSDDGHDDTMLIEASSSGSYWNTVEEVTSRREWIETQYKVSDYVTPTSTVYVRFSVMDEDSDSTTEAAIDAFSVSYADCNKLLLTTEMIFAGQETTLTADEATPGQDVAFYYSIRGEGETYISTLDVTLDIQQAKLAGTATADGNGHAEYTASVPPNVHLLVIWLQAAEYHRVSNMVVTQIN